MAEEGLNRVMLLGRCAADPELRYTQSNIAVLSVRIGTTESWFDNKTRERKENTQWHNVVIWDKRAEGLNKILSKGSKIFVEGSLQTRSYEAKDGTKRYVTEVKANNVVLLGSKGEGGRGDAAEGAGRQEHSHDGTAGDFDDSEIPF